MNTYVWVCLFVVGVLGGTVLRLLLKVEKLKKDIATLSKLVSIDSLTGVPNRFSYEREVVKYWARWRREGAGMFVIMFIDLDRFKRINDNYGHECGDFVLKTAAQRMEQAVRKSDSLYRISGEEFVVVTMVDNREGALVLAEKLAAAVKVSPMSCGAEDISVTCSIGVSLEENVTVSKEEGYTSLYTAADKAMYAAKQAGRDRVSFAP